MLNDDDSRESPPRILLVAPLVCRPRHALMASHEQPGAASRGEVAPPPGAEAQPGGGELPSSVWSAWLNGTLSELHSRKLLRSLRPVVPTAVPTEASGSHTTLLPNTPPPPLCA